MDADLIGAGVLVPAAGLPRAGTGSAVSPQRATALGPRARRRRIGGGRAAHCDLTQRLSSFVRSTGQHGRGCIRDHIQNWFHLGSRSDALPARCGQSSGVTGSMATGCSPADGRCPPTGLLRELDSAPLIHGARGPKPPSRSKASSSDRPVVTRLAMAFSILGRPTAVFVGQRRSNQYQIAQYGLSANVFRIERA